MLKLQSCDGVIFELTEEVAKQSVVIKDMLEFTAGQKEGNTDDQVIPLGNVKSIDLEKIILLLIGFSSTDDKTEEFLSKESITDLFQLIVTVNYLDIPHLLQSTCNAVANRVREKTPNQIDSLFSSVNTTFSDGFVYDGKDLNLVSDPVCFNRNCEKHNYVQGSLLTCSQCGLLKYCSKVCQKEDFQYHQKSCQQIKKLKQEVEFLVAELRCHTGWNGEEVNLFVDRADIYFGDFNYPRDYCRTRVLLANKILDIAREYEHESLYDVALSHYVELMRLSHGDIKHDLLNRTPLILLSLNRDDDAYNFMKWWGTFLRSCRYDLRDPPPQDKYEDMFTVCSPLECIGVCFLAALAIIKFRIVAKHKQRLKEYETLLARMERSSLGRTLTDASHVIKDLLVGDKEWINLMVEQEEHLDKYLSMIQNGDKNFLSAVVNSGSLKSKHRPPLCLDSSVAHTYYCRLFYRIPGALERIKGIVDANPICDTS